MIPLPCEILTTFPYAPLYPANITVPLDAALIFVPFGAAISSPVCPLLLILYLLPNLEVIIPDIGFTVNVTPFNEVTFVDVFLLEVVELPVFVDVLVLLDVLAILIDVVLVLLDILLAVVLLLDVVVVFTVIFTLFKSFVILASAVLMVATSF